MRREQAVKEEKTKSELTFKPTIKKMVKEQDLSQVDLTPE